MPKYPQPNQYPDATKQAALLPLPISKASKSYNLPDLYKVMALFRICKTDQKIKILSIERIKTDLSPFQVTKMDQILLNY